MFKKLFNFSNKKPNTLVTIDRLYGSKGDSIAKAVADRLGAEYFDENIIELKTLETQVDISSVSKEDSFLKGTVYDLYRENDSYQEEDMMISDARFLADAKTIRDIAKGRNAVILGKCAGYILRDYKPLNIFIACDFEDRVKNIMNQMDYDEEKATSKIKKMDFRRINHYDRFTKGSFGRASDYDFTINSSRFSQEEIVNIIIYFIENYSK